MRPSAVSLSKTLVHILEGTSRDGIPPPSPNVNAMIFLFKFSFPKRKSSSDYKIGICVIMYEQQWISSLLFTNCYYKMEYLHMGLCTNHVDKRGGRGVARMTTTFNNSYLVKVSA